MIVGIILVVFVMLTALIVFTRWVVHSEVRNLTQALHREVMGLSAKLELIVGRRWTDAKLDEAFNDLRTIAKSHSDSIDEIRRDHIRNHGGGQR